MLPTIHKLSLTAVFPVYLSLHVRKTTIACRRPRTRNDDNDDNGGDDEYDRRQRETTVSPRSVFTSLYQRVATFHPNNPYRFAYTDVFDIDDFAVACILLRKILLIMHSSTSSRALNYKLLIFTNS